MKVWKAKECPLCFLEKKLNELQKAGKEIKTIYPLVSDGYTRSVQIVYIEEDVAE